MAGTVNLIHACVGHDHDKAQAQAENLVDEPEYVLHIPGSPYIEHVQSDQTILVIKYNDAQKCNQHKQESAGFR